MNFLSSYSSFSNPSKGAHFIFLKPAFFALLAILKKELGLLSTGPSLFGKRDLFIFAYNSTELDIFLFFNSAK